MKKNELIKLLENKQKNAKRLSTWKKGVFNYALELIDNLEGDDIPNKGIREKLLNGAYDWYDYSWGGCSLIYDEDIAKALCTPSELKRTDNGRLKPNRGEDWLDRQARALIQACYMIVCLVRDYENDEEEGERV